LPYALGWVAILIILIPHSDAKLLSWNYSETVHGIKSPEGRRPRFIFSETECWLISPSKHI